MEFLRYKCTKLFGGDWGDTALSTGVPRGGFKPPPIESSNKFSIVCLQNIYTLQALLLSSLNPKFYTGKR